MLSGKLLGRALATTTLCAGLLVLPACETETGPEVTNQDPIARIFAPVEGLSSAHGEALNLTGSCIDPESPEETVSAVWQSDIDGVLVEDNPDEQGNVSGTSFALTEGAHSISLVCTDPEGATGTDSKSIIVEPNEAPRVEIEEPDNGDDFTTDEAVTMVITVLDDVDAAEALLVSVESDLDGPLATDLIPNSDGEVVVAVSLLSGDHLLQASALDLEGAVGTATVTVSVETDHVPPACEILQPLDSSFQTGTSILFQGSVNDEDVTPEMLEVHFSTDLDGDFASLTPDTAGQVETFYDGLSVGEHILTMRVIDEEAFECTAETPLRVCELNEPATVSLDEPVEGSYLSGDPIVFSAVATDDLTDSSDLRVSWSSDLDGEFNNASADSFGQLFFQYDALSAGDHVVTLTIDDLCGNTTSSAVSISVEIDDVEEFAPGETTGRKRDKGNKRTRPPIARVTGASSRSPPIANTMPPISSSTSKVSRPSSATRGVMAR